MDHDIWFLNYQAKWFLFMLIPNMSLGTTAVRVSSRNSSTWFPRDSGTS